ncbi:MAG TPA: energy transducer TonB [Polyangiales bacterium]|nr:energy transducer TonB [Polyangiales bacterium]
MGSLQSPLDVERVASRVPVVAGSLAATLLHGLLLMAAVVAPSVVPKQRLPQRPSLVNELIQVEQEPPAPPPEPAQTPPPPQAAAPPPPPKAAAIRRAKEPQAAAPAAATAAKVLDAPKDEVLDFGDTFVQGQASQYPGGATEASGTSQAVVRDTQARAFGSPEGRGTAAIDRSREPQLADGTHWACPFPDEADDGGLDTAVVGLKVRVAADGTLEGVEISQDPGHGFGREARRCALRKRWQAGRDRAGNPIAGTRLLNIRFQR